MEENPFSFNSFSSMITNRGIDSSLHQQHITLSWPCTNTLGLMLQYAVFRTRRPRYSEDKCHRCPLAGCDKAFYRSYDLQRHCRLKHNATVPAAVAAAAAALNQQSDVAQQPDTGGTDAWGHMDYLAYCADSGCVNLPLLLLKMLLLIAHDGFPERLERDILI